MQPALINGIQEIAVGDDILPVRIVGAHQFQPNKQVLVIFSGALSERKGRTPPFFSGGGRAKELKLPLLAFSDPTLAWNDEIKLAWYAGNAKVPDLPDRIAGIIDHFAETYGILPILVGGSGGGFAALNVARRCRCTPRVFVWGPQTRISKYIPETVDLYLKTAFPSLYTKEHTIPERAEKILAEAGVSNAIFDTYWARDVVYIQNRSDNHLKKHMEPFLKAESIERLGASSFKAPNRKVGFFIGTWGKGHVVPPLPILNGVLSRMAKSTSTEEILEYLEQDFQADDPLFIIDDDVKSRMVVTTQKVDNTVSVSIEVSGVDIPDGAHFACYFGHDKSILHKTRYQLEPVFTYMSPDTLVNRVVVFVRDEIGQIHTISKQLAV